MKTKEPNKTKEVLQIEAKLKPDSIFFSKSNCCGDSWFMDKNYRSESMGDSWRISHNLKTKKLHLVKYSQLAGARVQGLRFKTVAELLSFIKKHFK